MFSLVLVAGQAAAEARRWLRDASGVHCLAGSCWLVGNDPDSNNAYFELKVDAAQLPLKPWRIPFRQLVTHLMNTKNALDLEAIDSLFGEVVVLSEQRALLLAKDGPLVDFGGECRELRESRHGQGLEGLAVREVDGKAWITVIHEGGPGGGTAKSPRILTLQVAQENLSAGEPIAPGQCKYLRLSKSRLKRHVGSKRRVRVPGLESISLGEEPGYLLLMSTRKDKWLQKVDLEGKLRGCAKSLAELDREWVKKNWEDLSWIDRDGKQVILVNDSKRQTYLWRIPLSERFLRDLRLNPDCS